MDAQIRDLLDGDLSGVHLTRMTTDDAWIRDYGPIFVRSVDEPRSLHITDWRFNSWGEKYGPWDHDDRVPSALGELLGLPVKSPGIVLEGGSVDVDGDGTLLTTESCLLHPNRNPERDRQSLERFLGTYLGAETVLWLGQGIAGDDTDGHVDDLTRFVAPGTVVTVLEEDPGDENYRPLQENLERLHGMTDARGRRLEVLELPMPLPVYHEGYRCPASYANFYIANESVLMPCFGSPRDEKARGVLAEAFPDRRVVAIDCRDVVWGLGAIHCVTQQEPAALNPA
jgi:agmatine deiminase